MYPNVLEGLSIIATIDPQTVANSEVFSDVIDMGDYEEVFAVALTGAMASETIDFKAYYCVAAGSSAVELKAATQLAAHADNNDGAQVAIHVRPDDVIAATQDTLLRFVKFGLVTGGATGGPCGVVVFGKPRYTPASGNDLATVKQRKY
jgi:hypothetical protein